MSKLYDTYLLLKANEEENSDNIIYLFKSGIFFICLDEDAKIASKILNLKLTYFNERIVKCGFPVNSLEKYNYLISLTNYQFKIIDCNSNISYSTQNYSTDEKIKDLLQKICSIDIDNLSVREAYEFIDSLKLSATSIISTSNIGGITNVHQ